MGAVTGIQWTDSTMNGWLGCAKVGPGCDHCYAEAALDNRLRLVNWGHGQPRKHTSASYWEQPKRWNDTPFFECAHCHWRGTDRDRKKAFARHGKCCLEMDLRPARRRVFCSSLSDVFDNEVPQLWRTQLFALIYDTPNLDWLLLTKRIGNATRMMREDPPESIAREVGAGLPNVWIGATVVNQEEADRDIPKLLATPARLRFLSMEPLLGPVDLRLLEYSGARERDGSGTVLTTRRRALDWVIVGGESGINARPLQLEWVRSLVQQCKAAGAPVHVKQLGQFVLDDGMSSPGQHWPITTVREENPAYRFSTDQEPPPAFVIRLKDRKGGSWKEWPADLRVREFPEVQCPA
jgi:protein gp37